jgi:hypothetical protein
LVTAKRVTALSYQPFKILGLLVGVIFLSENSLALCRDLDAIAAGNEKAKSYFKEAEVFHPGVVQKVHHPSKKKEVASYVKAGDKRYSIFTLIDHDCKAQFRKRTRQGD